MPRPSGQTAKKDKLTLAQLAAYDDILTDALIDHVRRPAARTFNFETARLTEIYADLLLDDDSQEPHIVPPV